MRGTRSAFLEIPIQMSHVIQVASKYGFEYHHARGQKAVLCKWLVENEENKIPNFSNHTVGVAGRLQNLICEFSNVTNPIRAILMHSYSKVS